MKPLIDFKTSNYFSGMPYLLGFVLTAVGFMLLFSPKILAGLILLLAGITVLTSHFRLSVDLNKMIYTEYISLLGMKVSKELHRFDEIQYLFVKKSKVSQNMNSRVSTHTIQKEQFNGYLKFSENDKVHLMTYDSKNAIIKRMRPIATLLSTKLIDYTIENPVEIK